MTGSRLEVQIFCNIPGTTDIVSDQTLLGALYSGGIVSEDDVMHEQSRSAQQSGMWPERASKAQVLPNSMYGEQVR